MASEWRPVHGRQINAKFYWLTVPGLRALQRHPFEQMPTHVNERLVTTLALIAMFSSNGEGVAASRAPHPILTLVIDARVRIRSDEVARATVEVTRICNWLAGPVYCDDASAHDGVG